MELYNYKAEYLRTIDGDTVKLRVALGLRIFREENIRLARINTPEIFSKDPELKAKAYEAKDFVRDWMENEMKTYGCILIKTKKPDSRDKYGRWLGTIISQDDPNLTLNDLLVQVGLAKIYE